jgi:hypothetical protein
MPSLSLSLHKPICSEDWEKVPRGDLKEYASEFTAWKPSTTYNTKKIQRKRQSI